MQPNKFTAVWVCWQSFSLSIDLVKWSSKCEFFGAMNSLVIILIQNPVNRCLSEFLESHQKHDLNSLEARNPSVINLKSFGNVLTWFHWKNVQKWSLKPSNIKLKLYQRKQKHAISIWYKISSFSKNIEFENWWSTLVVIYFSLNLYNIVDRQETRISFVHLYYKHICGYFIRHMCVWVRSLGRSYFCVYNRKCWRRTNNQNKSEYILRFGMHSYVVGKLV